MYNLMSVIICIIVSYILPATGFPYDIRSLQVDKNLSNTVLVEKKRNEVINITENNGSINIPVQELSKIEKKLKDSFDEEKNSIVPANEVKSRFSDNLSIVKKTTFPTTYNMKKYTNPKDSPKLFNTNAKTFKREHIRSDSEAQQHILSPSVFGTDEQVRNVASKRKTALVPPFPELTQVGNRRLNFAQEGYIDRLLNEKFEFNPTTTTVAAISKVSKSAEHFFPEFQKKEQLYPTKQNPEAIFQRKFHFGTEEETFQSVPVRRYMEIQNVPPFEELDVQSNHRKDEASEEKKLELLFVPEVKDAREHAGPELFASSIFEREVRVPFI